MSSNDLLLRPLRGIPSIAQGDNIGKIIVESIQRMGERLQSGDVLVVTQKIVSKSEGRVRKLSEVVPSARAIELAAKAKKDPRVVELILGESTEIVRCVPGLIVVAHRLGLVLANAGIDRSNSDGEDNALLLPEDPDVSAYQIQTEILAQTGQDVGVLIIDSIGRAWRLGTIGTAVGVSGIPALLDLRGRPDRNGRRLESTEIALADELAAAASLVMGQGAEGTPVVLARGVPYERKLGAAKDLIRPKHQDQFR